MSIAVVFPTKGRPDVLYKNVTYFLQHQILQPEIVIISCTCLDDVGDLIDIPGIKIIIGPPGSSAQRNAAFAVIQAGIEIIVFFDDDFVAHSQWLNVAARAFRENNEIVGLTGNVIVDDIKGPGLSFFEATRVIENFSYSNKLQYIHPFSPYGCNMAFRLSAVSQIRFDERLVLYGWLEDRDFGSRVSRNGGLLVKCTTACGVHMGVKQGRVSGVKIGYSQIINPLYLHKKKSMTSKQVAGQIFRNLMSNIFFSIKPEPYIDRRGRLKGNLIGFLDAMRLKIDPQRALQMNNIEGGKQ